MPVAGNYLLEDIADWRKLKFPEPRKWNWDMIRAMELDGYDGSKCLVYFCEEGLFDRLTTLMGFMEALIALVTEPEEVYAFFDRFCCQGSSVPDLMKYHNPAFCKIPKYFFPSNINSSYPFLSSLHLEPVLAISSQCRVDFYNHLISSLAMAS